MLLIRNEPYVVLTDSATYIFFSNTGFSSQLLRSNLLLIFIYLQFPRNQKHNLDPFDIHVQHVVYVTRPSGGHQKLPSAKSRERRSELQSLESYISFDECIDVKERSASKQNL